MAARPYLSRRGFLRASAASALMAATSRAAHAAPTPPNFVIILADDLGYGDLGCYGNTAVHTPRIDALASAGLRFTDFHSNGAVCSPTRSALLTGCYPQRLGIENVLRPDAHRDKPGLPLERQTFANVLKSAGYATGMMGKWHLGYPAAYNPVNRGFDTFRGYLSGNVDYQSHIDGSGAPDWWDGLKPIEEKGYTTHLVTQHGVQFIEQHQSAPFCLYLAHEAVHAPYQGPNDPAGRVAGKNDGPGEARKDTANAYREMLAALDDGVGAIVDTLKRLDLESNTYVIFLSDNGAVPLGSNGPLSGNKGGLLEGGHRVPAIVYRPGTVKPGTTDATAMTMDLLPTLAEIAGATVEQKDTIDGISLAPVIAGTGTLPERTIFWRTNGTKPEKAARRGPWKLRTAEGKTSLFNLATDLAEHTDVATEHADVLGNMQNDLKKWEEKFRDVPSLV